MPRRTAGRWAARKQAPTRLWLVGLLAFFFAAATLLHTGEGHTAFGDGGHFAVASIGDVPCDSDGVDYDKDQHCVAVSCHFCVPVTAVLALQLPKAAPVAVAMIGHHADRSLLPQFRPPKLSAQA
jgi:hypothetical protein